MQRASGAEIARAVVPLEWRALFALLLAMFVIAVGYGLLLPILPFTIERIAGAADPTTLSRHTGLLTGSYTVALFLFAPLWGWVADLRGRRPVILLGLAGFAACHLLFIAVDNLPLLYFSRFLAGFFASTVTPAAYALVGDHAMTKEWRAHRFALLNIAGAIGFLAGPMLGSFSFLIAREILPGLTDAATFRAPFFVTSGFTFFVALTVWLLVPKTAPRKIDRQGATKARDNRAILMRLLVISFVTAAAVGAFEVGLSLRAAQVLGMNTYQLGLMFTECSLVMLVVQSIVFSPIVKPDTTRWLLMPSLAVLAAGLLAVPLSAAGITMAISVALIAASAGTLSPVATYWVSLGAHELQGTELGRQTAAASLGQAVGSAAGGLLFNVTLLPNAPFTITAMLVLAALASSIGLPRLLSRAGEPAVNSPPTLDSL